MKMVKIPAPKKLMDIEKSGRELPTSIQKDLVTLIAVGYVAQMGTMKPKKSIIKIKLKSGKKYTLNLGRKRKYFYLFIQNFKIHTN